MTANSKNQAKKEFRLKIPFTVLLFLSSMSLWSQTSNSDFERIKLNSVETEYSGIALSPDNKTIAITAKKSGPVQIIDEQSLFTTPKPEPCKSASNLGTDCLRKAMEKN